MRLIPRALRPMAMLRRVAMKSGIRSQNQYVRMIAFALVGRPAVIRRTANRQGLVGNSGFWRIVAFGFIVGDLYRKLAVKEPERLGVERLVEGQSVTILALAPDTRRARRRAARAS